MFRKPGSPEPESGPESDPESSPRSSMVSNSDPESDDDDDDDEPEEDEDAPSAMSDEEPEGESEPDEDDDGEEEEEEVDEEEEEDEEKDQSDEESLPEPPRAVQAAANGGLRQIPPKSPAKSKVPAGLDFDLSAGLNVTKKSVGSSMIQNLKALAEQRVKAEAEAKIAVASEEEKGYARGRTNTRNTRQDEESGSESGPSIDGDQQEGVGDSGKRGSHRRGSHSYHWGKRSSKRTSSADSTASSRLRTSISSMSMYSGLSKQEINRRMTNLLPIALAGGFSPVACKFTGFGDDFEDAFVRISQGADSLEILLSTGDSAVFDLVDEESKCSFESRDIEGSSMVHFNHGRRRVEMRFAASQQRNDFIASVPASFAISGSTVLDETAMIVVGGKVVRSVEDLLEGAEENADVVLAKEGEKNEGVAVEGGSSRPLGPPPAQSPDDIYFAPPRASPLETAPGSAQQDKNKKTEKRKTVFIRPKIPSVARTQQLCHWLNTLGLQATPIKVLTLDKDFCTGLLLCDLIKALVRDVRYSPLNRRPLSKKAAVANIEQAIEAIFQSSKAVHSRRIASTDDIFNGNTHALAIMLDEIFNSFVHKKLFSSGPLGAMLSWYADVLEQHGLKVPVAALVEARGGDKFLKSGLRDAFQSGLALFCVVLHFFGSVQIGQSGESEEGLFIDPHRVFSNPDSVEKIRSNVTYVFSLLQAMGVPLLWEVDEWIAFSDVEFVVLQLRCVYTKLRGATCALPVLPTGTEPAKLVASGKLVTLGVDVTVVEKPKVVGAVFADTVLAATLQQGLGVPSSVSVVPDAKSLLSPASKAKITEAVTDPSDKSKGAKWNIQTLPDGDLFGVTENPSEYLHIARLQLAGRTDGGGPPSPNSVHYHYERPRFRAHTPGFFNIADDYVSKCFSPGQLGANSSSTEAAQALLAETRARVERDQSAILKEIEHQEDLLADKYALLDINADTYSTTEYDALFDELEQQREQLEKEREFCDDVFAARYDALRAQEEDLERFNAGAGPSPYFQALTTALAPSIPPSSSVRGMFSKSSPSATAPSPNKKMVSPSVKAKAATIASGSPVSASPPTAAPNRRSSISQDLLHSKGHMITGTRSQNAIIRKASADSQAFMSNAKTPPSLLKRKSMAAEVIERNAREKEKAETPVLTPLEKFEKFKDHLAEQSRRWREAEELRLAGKHADGRDLGTSHYKTHFNYKPPTSPPATRVPMPEDYSFKDHLLSIGSQADEVLRAVREEEMSRMAYEEKRREIFISLQNSLPPPPPPSESMVQVTAAAALWKSVSFQPPAAPAADSGSGTGSQVADALSSGKGAMRYDEDSLLLAAPVEAAPAPAPTPAPAPDPAPSFADVPVPVPASAPALAPIPVPVPVTNPASVSASEPTPASLSAPEPAPEPAPQPASLSEPAPAPPLASVQTPVSTTEDSASTLPTLAQSEPPLEDQALPQAPAAAPAPRGSISLVDPMAKNKSSGTALRRTHVGPLSAEEMAKRIKWLTSPRSVVLDDARRTASLFPKNATMSLKAPEGQGQARTGQFGSYSLLFWETAGMQLVSPTKQPTFQVKLQHVIQAPRRGDGKDVAKVFLQLAEDNLDALRDSGGRRVVSFRCMNADDAETFVDFLGGLCFPPTPETDGPSWPSATV